MKISFDDFLLKNIDLAKNVLLKARANKMQQRTVVPNRHYVVKNRKTEVSNFEVKSFPQYSEKSEDLYS